MATINGLIYQVLKIPPTHPQHPRRIPLPALFSSFLPSIDPSPDKPLSNCQILRFISIAETREWGKEKGSRKYICQMAAEERRMYREAVNGPLVTVNVVQWVDAADGRRLVVPLLKFGCLRCMQLMRQRHRHRFFGQRRDKASHGIFRDWEVRNYITIN